MIELSKKIYRKIRGIKASMAERFRLAVRIVRCRQRYSQIVQRLRSKGHDSKILVLFLNSEIAKWECQTVYEKMAASEIFEPIVGITALGEQTRYSDEELSVAFQESEKFFDGLGVRHVRVVTLFPRKYDDLKSLNPDIVFFPEPWCQVYPQTTEAVSEFPDFAYRRERCDFQANSTWV